MLPGEMADGVETREQRRRRRIGLGLDPDGESEDDTGEGDPGDGAGGVGPPGHGDGDGGDAGDGDGGLGGPGESDSESDPGDDDTARAIKKQTKSLVSLAKTIKTISVKERRWRILCGCSHWYQESKEENIPPYLQRRQRRET